MSNQGDIQGSIRVQTGTALSHTGDWHALFDAEGISAGTYNERLLRFLNAALGASHTTLADAQAAYAADQGVDTWANVSDIPPTTPEGFPSRPAAPTATAGDEQVSVAWVAPADGGSPLTDYTIQFSVDAGQNWTPIVDGVGVGTTLTHTSLTNGESYTYRVAATNANGTGSFSLASSAAIPSGVPAQVGTVTPVAGTTQVALSWAAPDDNGSVITSYEVQQSVDSGVSWASAGSTSGLSLTATGLTAGTAHVFRVRAVNANGAGSYSAASAAATPIDVPSVVQTLALTAGDNQLAASWTAPADTNGSAITGYRVEFRTGSDAFALFETAATTSSTITGLTGGVAYDVRVAAQNAAGTGPYATETETPTGATVAPTVTTSPVIAYQSGSTYALTDGVYAGSPTPTIDASNWQADTVDIAGATSSTFDVTGRSNSEVLRVLQDVSNSAGSIEAPSNTITLTQAAISGVPTIANTSGTILTATLASVSGEPDSYTSTGQWYADGTPIGGATASTYDYSSQAADVIITYQQRETNGVGVTATANSLGFTVPGSSPSLEPYEKYFSQSSAWTSHYNGVIYPIAYYSATDQKTYYAQEAVQWGNPLSDRSVWLHIYNNSTDAWESPVLVSLNTLANDDHGAPAVTQDNTGRLIIYYGSHVTDQFWAIEKTPGSLVFEEREKLDGQWTYPHIIITPIDANTDRKHLIMRRSNTPQAYDWLAGNGRGTSSPMTMRVGTLATGGNDPDGDPNPTDHRDVTWDTLTKVGHRTYAVNDAETLTVTAANGLLSTTFTADSMTLVSVEGVAPGGGNQTLSSGAIINVAADGSFTYDPNSAFGTVSEQVVDRLRYIVSDGTHQQVVLLYIIVYETEPTRATPAIWNTAQDLDIIEVEDLADSGLTEFSGTTGSRVYFRQSILVEDATNGDEIYILAAVTDEGDADRFHGYILSIPATPDANGHYIVRNLARTHTHNPHTSGPIGIADLNSHFREYENVAAATLDLDYGQMAISPVNGDIVLVYPTDANGDGTAVYMVKHQNIPDIKTDSANYGWSTPVQIGTEPAVATTPVPITDTSGLFWIYYPDDTDDDHLREGRIVQRRLFTPSTNTLGAATAVVTQQTGRTYTFNSAAEKLGIGRPIPVVNALPELHTILAEKGNGTGGTDLYGRTYAVGVEAAPSTTALIHEYRPTLPTGLMITGPEIREGDWSTGDTLGTIIPTDGNPRIPYRYTATDTAGNRIALADFVPETGSNDWNFSFDKVAVNAGATALTAGTYNGTVTVEDHALQSASLSLPLTVAATSAFSPADLFGSADTTAAHFEMRDLARIQNPRPTPGVYIERFFPTFGGFTGNFSAQTAYSQVPLIRSGSRFYFDFAGGGGEYALSGIGVGGLLVLAGRTPASTSEDQLICGTKRATGNVGNNNWRVVWTGTQIEWQTNNATTSFALAGNTDFVFAVHHTTASVTSPTVYLDLTSDSTETGHGDYSGKVGRVGAFNGDTPYTGWFDGAGLLNGTGSSASAADVQDYIRYMGRLQGRTLT